MPHPGISMHKIPVEHGEGMDFCLLSRSISTILIALPVGTEFRVSLPIGVTIAIILRSIHRD